MRVSVQTTLVYLVISHLLLLATSPIYRHELKRAFGATRAAVLNLSYGWTGQESSTVEQQQPRSGVYASTELLHAVQQHMQLDTSLGVYTAQDLIAYMSASDVIKGQGGPARATLFMQLLAPRFTLLPVRSAFLTANMQLFALSAADLPAVGPIEHAEDPSAGYRLSCSSPTLDYGLGPQPAVTCRVLGAAGKPKFSIPDRVYIKRVDPTVADAPGEHIATHREDSASNMSPRQLVDAKQDSSVAGLASSAVRAPSCGVCRAALGLYTSLQGSFGRCCARKLQMHIRPAGLNTAEEKPLATWTIVPTGVEGNLEEHAGGTTLLSDPIAAASPAPGSVLALLFIFDEWLVFPRTQLLRLLPSMSGIQQLLYGIAAFKYSWLDLVYLISAMQRLHLRSAATMLAGRWSILTAACSVTLQLIMLVWWRMIVSMLLSSVGLGVLHHMLRFAKVSAVYMNLPTLRWLGFLLWIRGHFGWGWCVAAGSTAAAVVGAALGAICGMNAVSAAAIGGSATAMASMVHRMSTMWSAKLGLNAANGAATAAGAGMQSAAAVAAADVAAGVVDRTSAAAGVVRKLLSPHYAKLLSIHQICEDLVYLTVAQLVWDLADRAFVMLWQGLMMWGVELQVLIEASAAAAALLLQGSSWQAAYRRFRQVQHMQLEQRRAEVAAEDELPNRFQAQVILHAPGDLGQAAEALHNLADELEHLAQQPLGFMATFGGLGNLLHSGMQRRRSRVRVLGDHWPAELQIPFDLEDLQSGLGVEVPRGFVCPITQDLMRQPALLISSTVTVPATYDKDAITRWLQSSRLDPKSRQPLAADAQLVPNMDLYRSIEDWVSEKQQQWACKQQQQQQQQQLEHQPQQGLHQSAGAAAANLHQPGAGLLSAARGAVAAAAAGVGLGSYGHSPAADACGSPESPSMSEDPDFSAGDVSLDSEASLDESDYLTSEELGDLDGEAATHDDVLPAAGTFEQAGMPTPVPVEQQPIAPAACRYRFRRRPAPAGAT